MKIKSTWSTNWVWGDSDPDFWFGLFLTALTQKGKSWKIILPNLSLILPVVIVEFLSHV